MSKSELRLAIQSYRFAAHDMLLFLDTHPEDKKGFEIFKSLTKKANELQNEYQRKWGPLNVRDAAEQAEFNWIDSPWPWEKGGNC